MLKSLHHSLLITVVLCLELSICAPPIIYEQMILKVPRTSAVKIAYRMRQGERRSRPSMEPPSGTVTIKLLSLAYPVRQVLSTCRKDKGKGPSAKWDEVIRRPDDKGPRLVHYKRISDDVEIPYVPLSRSGDNEWVRLRDDKSKMVKYTMIQGQSGTAPADGASQAGPDAVNAPPAGPAVVPEKEEDLDEEDPEVGEMANNLQHMSLGQDPAGAAEEIDSQGQ